MIKNHFNKKTLKEIIETEDIKRLNELRRLRDIKDKQYKKTYKKITQERIHYIKEIKDLFGFVYEIAKFGLK